VRCVYCWGVTMNHLYDRAFGLFWAYVMRAEPLDTEFQASIIFGMQKQIGPYFYAPNDVCPGVRRVRHW
jgi:hypothetical protein